MFPNLLMKDLFLTSSRVNIRMQYNYLQIKLMENCTSEDLPVSAANETLKKQSKRMAFKLKTSNNSDDSDQFQLEHHQIKRLKLPINKSRLNSGCWSQEQNLIYLKFLEKNKAMFESEETRRKSRVFYFLAKLMRRRNPDQCRSHHQKLQLKYHSDLNFLLVDQLKKINKQSQINIEKLKFNLNKLTDVPRTNSDNSLINASTEPQWHCIDDKHHVLALKIDFGRVSHF